MTLHIDSRNYMQLHYDYGIQCRPSTQHKLDSQEQRNYLQNFILQFDEAISNTNEIINEQILAIQAKKA